MQLSHAALQLNHALDPKMLICLFASQILAENGMCFHLWRLLLSRGILAYVHSRSTTQDVFMFLLQDKWRNLKKSGEKQL